MLLFVKSTVSEAENRYSLIVVSAINYDIFHTKKKKRILSRFPLSADEPVEIRNLPTKLHCYTVYWAPPCIHPVKIKLLTILFDAVVVVTGVIDFATRLGQKLDVLDDRVPADRLAHVVDRQCGHGAGRQAFHFDAGPVGADRRGRNPHQTPADVQTGVHRHRVQPDLMAQRYQLPRHLGRAYSRQPSDGQHVALLARVLGNQPSGRTVQPDSSYGRGRPPRFPFFRDVDHARVARLPVHVRQTRRA